MWDREIQLTEEDARIIQIMLYGTTEERAALKALQRAESAIWERNIVATKAYYLWENAGRPNDRDVEFWLEAEAQWNKECDEYEPCIYNGIAY